MIRNLATFAVVVTAIALLTSSAAAQQNSYQPPSGQPGYGGTSGSYQAPTGQRPQQGPYQAPNSPAYQQPTVGSPGLPPRTSMPPQQATAGRPPMQGMQPGMMAQPQNMQPQNVGPQVPFTLTPQQQAELDQMLQAWESYSQQVKNFSCNFSQHKYKTTVAGQHVEVLGGAIQYKAPDHGLFEVKGKYENGRFIEGMDAQKLICDGQAVYDYSFSEKVIYRTTLSPEMQGANVITNGPVPFILGAKADLLKQRYFMRIITPNSPQTQGQVWLEVWPRHQRDAAEFHHVELILTRSNMSLLALKMYHLDGHDSDSYTFSQIKINEGSGGGLIPFVNNNPFKVTTPNGWKLVDKDQISASSQQVGSQPQTNVPR